ncbi:MAG: transporter [Rhodobiaceae bacterium]|nr:transporter [Rhodobiaceae bacterium]
MTYFPKLGTRVPKLKIGAWWLFAFTVSFALAPLSHPALADTPSRPDSHAPIGVMGDHRHKAGEWMVSVRHMNMSMKGNLKGRQSISEAQVLQLPNQHGSPANLRVVPQTMDMKMTMLGAMYAPNDTITLLAMTMQHETTMRLNTYGAMSQTLLGSFTSQSEGLGDTTLGALIAGGEIDKGILNGQWHYGLALSVPTGSIKQTGSVLSPMNMRASGKRLPYPMQLGSGTYDVKPSLTFNNAAHGDWRYSGQLAAVVRLDDNAQGYRLGDKAHLQAWASRRLAPFVSASMRLDASHQQGLKGSDAAITLPVPTAQTNFSGGQLAHLSFGFNFVGQAGLLHGHRLALEWTRAIHQKARGVQMQHQDTLTLGYQKAW